MSKVYKIKEIRGDAKWAYRKEQLKQELRKARVLVYNNKELVIGLASVLIPTITAVVKVGGKRINLRKEQKLKDCYCYDPSLGHYWKLKRKLSNREWTEIDRRKSDGERLAAILSDLNVLD